MIWQSVNRDFFTEISSTQMTRKFHFWLQKISGGITLDHLKDDAVGNGNSQHQDRGTLQLLPARSVDPACPARQRVVPTPAAAHGGVRD